MGKKNLDELELPEFYLTYMSEMILEEPPRNERDLENLFLDFLRDKPRMTTAQQSTLLKTLFLELKGVVAIEGANLHAKRLGEPFSMDEVQLITDYEESAGYTDTPFSFELMKFHNDFINTEKINSNQSFLKKKEAEKRRKLEEHKRRQQEISALGERLPPIQFSHSGDSGCVDVKVDSFSLDIGGKVLIEDSMLSLSSGRKYGFIGKNGTGKTTLMYAIAKKAIKGIPAKPQILMIEQEIVGDDKTSLDTILSTDSERTNLLAEEADLRGQSGGEDRLTAIYERLEEIEANKAEIKAISLLKGLGFSEKMISEPTKLLSGGWRMRVALAKVLFCSPDILLLDEPTNHLDLDAVMWLENYISNFENTVLVVSHARDFLNNVCTDIINLENQKLTYFRGNFEDFETQKLANIERQKKEFQNQQNNISHVQSFINKFRYNAKKASLVQSRLKYLDRIKVVEDVTGDSLKTVFNFPKPELVRPPIIRIDEGAFSYPDCPVLLENLNFSIDMNSKIALLGANGVGKTTFLKLLLGELQNQEGSLYSNKKARVSMFSQHHVDKLDMTLSPMEQFMELYPDSSNEFIRKHLARFGIIGNTCLRPIYQLSGGQKSRVSLSMAAWTNPHILIMDEPTNHLDMESVDALIVALNEYEGGLLIVSHDQYFVSCVCDEIWYIKNKKLKIFNGDFEMYRNCLIGNKLA